MSNSSLHLHLPRTADPPITLAHLLVLAFASLGAALWGAALILGSEGIQFEQYLLLLGLLALASGTFLFTRIRGNSIGVFYFPVFLTILIFLRFGLAPMASFLDPRSLNHNFDGHYEFLLRALAYVILGMLAFWAGCGLAFGKTGAGGPQSADRPREPGNAEYSVLAWAVAIYSVVLVTKLYLLHAHLYSYVGSWKAYQANLGSLQVLGVVSGLGGPAALILVTIERYFHPSDIPARLLFWVVLVSQCAWGLASGMKDLVLQPFIIVAVISSLTERKFKKGWVVAVLLGLIVLYPLSNNYRRLVQHQGGLTSVAEVVSTGLQALSETQQGQGGTSGWLQNGWRMSVGRLDMLTSFGLVLFLGHRASLLQGRERWWMVPYYPFIPRIVWKSKPVLNKGARFSVAVGSTRTSSMAITYPGDLYAVYGLPGILAGMFLLGVVSQWLANTITGTLDKRHLFVYAAIFLSFSHLETDAFSYWTGLIKSFVILSVIALVIYRPRRRALKALMTREKSVGQPCGS